jgi:Effector-associated domain 1
VSSIALSSAWDHSRSRSVDPYPTGPDRVLPSASPEWRACSLTASSSSSRIKMSCAVSNMSWRNRLAYLLARAKSDPEGARIMARRAGFPLEHIPQFSTPLEFWSRIVKEAHNGRIELLTLLDEALREFPHSRALRDLLAEAEHPPFHSGNSTTTRPRLRSHPLRPRTLPSVWLMISVLVTGFTVSALVLAL